MRVGVVRALVISAACSLLLAGCESSSKFSDLLKPNKSGMDSAMASVEPKTDLKSDGATDSEPTGSIPGMDNPSGEPGLLGSKPNDDLNLGKKQFREQNFGLAEKHFRRAVETHPNDAEAWVGLAASYDRLRRFDLADRAYSQAIKILGPTPELLNNQGYSYMLRGDYKKARKTLLAAQAKAPDNQYVKNNLDLLADSYRKGKAIE
ncbi:MAG: tetratricopeptide repeat protein [Hyphomicrobiales bacterium]